MNSLGTRTTCTFHFTTCEWKIGLCFTSTFAWLLWKNVQTLWQRRNMGQKYEHILLKVYNTVHVLEKKDFFFCKGGSPQGRSVLSHHRKDFTPRNWWSNAVHGKFPLQLIILWNILPFLISYLGVPSWQYAIRRREKIVNDEETIRVILMLGSSEAISTNFRYPEQLSWIRLFFWGSVGVLGWKSCNRQQFWSHLKPKWKR